MNQSNIDLRDLSLSGIFKEIHNYFAVIICIGLSAVFISTAVGKMTYTPQYESTATMAVTVVGYNDYTSLQMASSMTDVFASVFENDALQRKISEAAGEDITGHITTKAIEETNLLNLTCTASDPRQAYLYLEMALENYSEVSGHVFSDSVLHLVQDPSIPMAPVNTSVLVRFRWLLGIGAALSVVFFVLIRYLLRFTVKTGYGASRLLDGDIIGVVEEEKFSRKHKNHSKNSKEMNNLPLLLSSPILSMRYSEQMRMTALHVEQHLRRKNQQVLLITSVLANEGKSSFAVNTASALAEHGKRVILLDGDLRLPTQFKLSDRSDRNSSSLTDVLSGNVPWRQALRKNHKTGCYNLYQMNAVNEPEKYMDGDRIKHLIQELKKYFDYVIIDTSPISVSREAEFWMQEADSAMVVVRRDLADVRAINDAVDLIWQITGDFAGFALNAFSAEDSTYFRRGEYDDWQQRGPHYTG